MIETLKLIDPTLDELDAVFAEKVAGWVLWPRIYHNQQWHDIPTWVEKRYIQKEGHAPPGWMLGCGHPRFTRSFDAVLPWLEKWPHAANIYYNDPTFGITYRWRVILWEPHVDTDSFSGVGSAEGGVLPYVIVLALLRAHGVEITFTK